jgi:hypothetical protein
MIAEYLEQAHLFERLAASETDPKNKAQLEGQAQAYYKLAQKRATSLGRPMPEGSPQAK